MFVAPNLSGPLPFERLPRTPQNAAASKRNQAEASNQQTRPNASGPREVAVLTVEQHDAGGKAVKHNIVVSWWHKHVHFHR